jgi:hypothetical protein
MCQREPTAGDARAVMNRGLLMTSAEAIATASKIFGTPAWTHGVTGEWGTKVANLLSD